MSDDDESEAPVTLEAHILRDLGADAAAGRLAPAYEMDALVDEVLDVLAARCSPVLIGETDVGKTAIAHAVVARLHAGGGPEWLRRGRAVLVELGSFGNEWGYDGGRATRKLRAFLDLALAHDPPLFLVVDHMNLAPRFAGPLVHFLGRSPLPIIGEHTISNPFHAPRYEGELAMKLVPVRVPEPPRPRVRAIVDRWCEAEARAGRASFDAPARQLALDLCARFDTNRHFPGKAIELLHQTRAVSAVAGVLGTAAIARRFSVANGVPRELVDPDAVLDLREVRRYVADRLLGQEEAVDAVIRIVAMTKAGLTDTRRPLGALLFVGPTGVGKTHAAQILARYLFGDPNKVFRLNMAEYNHPEHVHTVFGNREAVADNVQAGALTTRLGGASFGVLLLDEFEKAHPAVHDAFLQLIDEGMFVNGAEQVVSVRSFIIIATSNAGAESWRLGGLGFREAGEDRLRAVERRLHEIFRFELLNRFDRIVHFHPLDRGHIRAIAERELRDLAEREGVSVRGVQLELDPELLDWVVATGWHPTFGARWLRREIEKHVAGTLAEFLVVERPGRGARVALGVRAGRVVARWAEPEAPPPPSRPARPDLADLQARRERMTARWAPLAGEAERRREEASALLAATSEPKFWDDRAHAEEVLRAYAHLDARCQADARLLEPARRLEEIAPDDPEMLALWVEEAELALARWIELEGGAAADEAWLLLGPADPVSPVSETWLHELVELEVRWLGRVGLKVAVAAEQLVRGQVAGVVLEVSGPGATRTLSMESGVHRRKLRSGEVDRLVATVLPRGEREPAEVEGVRLPSGTFLPRRRARVVVNLAARGQRIELAGEAAESLGALAADLADAPAPTEVPVARIYGYDGVAARDPRTNAMVLTGRELRAGALEPLLRAWERREGR